MKIDAQRRNFKFLENKLSQITCDDIKWNENKAFWSKKIQEYPTNIFRKIDYTMS